MVDVQKIKIVSILCPVNLPPSRAHLVVYEPSYKKDVPVPTIELLQNPTNENLSTLHRIITL